MAVVSGPGGHSRPDVSRSKANVSSLSDTISSGAQTPETPTESSDLVSPVRRRRLAAASLAVTTMLSLGACGTGFSAQTNQVYQPAVGADARGDVDALNTLLVANPNGSATVSVGLQNNLTED